MTGLRTRHSLLRRLALCGALLGIAACATPRQPPGGPADQTPPVLAETVPASGAVEAEAEALRLTFSEYVDQASFGRAFSITPEPDGRVEVRWRGRTAVVRFPEPLRDSTTYIVTLDTNLRDARGVSLTQPITLAFSTGPQIDRGRLDGRVVDSKLGAPAAGLDVYAYAAPNASAPDALPERPAYRTQTDDQGRFTLDYLRQQPYYVIALADANRNRRPDAAEAYAVPPHPAQVPDTARTGEPAAWVVTRLDTVPPAVQRVRPRSSRRLEVRFAEAVRLLARDPAAWVLEDSSAARAVPVGAVYTRAAVPNAVYLRTDSMATGPHRLRVPPAVADSSGNAARPQTVDFSASAVADTFRLRFEGFVPAADTTGPAVLRPEKAPALRFNQPLDSVRLHALVAVQDTAGRALPYRARTDDGTTYRLYPDPPLAPGGRVRVAVAPPARPDTLLAQTFRRTPRSELGDLGGYVAAPDTLTAVVVELYRVERATPLAAAVPDAT
ncbi:MAG: Ig-like domain-containing protein, partial [Rhodothermales bacterium]|nr:Ig-like domain-containing protein [Rhodothermales bacterium]